MSKAPSNIFPGEVYDAAADPFVQAIKLGISVPTFINRVVNMKKQRFLHTQRSYLESLFGVGYYLNLEVEPGEQDIGSSPSCLSFAIYTINQKFCGWIRQNGSYQLERLEAWERPPMRPVEGSDWEQRVDWKLLVAKIRHTVENTAFRYPEV